MRKAEVRTVQLWRGGGSVTYRGNPDGPDNQRSLRSRGEGERWRKGSDDEWRQIRIALRAEMYADRYILRNQCALVDDLLKQDFAGFQWEDVRNVYRDCSDFDAEQCREYASDQGIDLPTTIRHTSCETCDLDIEGDIFSGGWRDRGNNRGAETAGGVRHEHAPAEADNETDQDDWLTEARQACAEHAQDNPAEVFEWYLVDRWLCEQLHEIGEVTIDNDYGEWWGRTCTGQALIMDGTLQQIAAKFEKGLE